MGRLWSDLGPIKKSEKEIKKVWKRDQVSFLGERGMGRLWCWRYLHFWRKRWVSLQMFMFVCFRPWFFLCLLSFTIRGLHLFRTLQTPTFSCDCKLLSRCKDVITLVFNRALERQFKITIWQFDCSSVLPAYFCSRRQNGVVKKEWFSIFTKNYLLLIWGGNN